MIGRQAATPLARIVGTALLALMPALVPAAAQAAPAPPVPTGPVAVEIVERNGGFVLLRGGEPYRIRGAGLVGSDLASLVERGGNSIRTWAADLPGAPAQTLLDEAQALGVTVSLCLNIARERHGFDYDDPEAVARQFEEARQTVLRYRDHPALLTWLIGNELNYDYSNPAVYDAVNDIARMIHELDPHHPVTTTTAGISASLLEDLQTRAPELDFLSVQLYGDLVNLPKYMDEFGYEGPYFITEWGAIGHWEMPQTPWGAPIEQDSSAKARNYRKGFDRVIAPHRDQVVGDYVFLWGQKQERTPTWYGLFTDAGEGTETLDVMTHIWTGEWPANRAPRVMSMTLDRRPAGANISLRSGRSYGARFRVSDPDGDAVSWRWSVKPESRSQAHGGDLEAVPPDLPGLIEDLGDGRIELSTDIAPGAYRLFAYASDGRGSAAHANIPFQIR